MDSKEHQEKKIILSVSSCPSWTKILSLQRDDVILKHLFYCFLDFGQNDLAPRIEITQNEAKTRQIIAFLAAGDGFG